MSGEMALIGESRGRGDLGQGRSLGNQRLRPGEPPPDLEAVR
jgi:hypothetical protein